MPPIQQNNPTPATSVPPAAPTSTPSAQTTSPTQPTQTPSNLYQYYTGQGQALPSVADRQGVASQAGIQNYTGTAQQNATLLSYLQNQSSQQNAQPQPQTTPAPQGATMPTGTTQTTDPNAPTTLTTPVKSQAEIDLEKAQADFQAQATSVQNQIANIQNGTTPLSPGEQAQVDGLKAQFQQLIDSQRLTNTGAEGFGQIRGYQTGAAEYDPTFQARTIGSIITAGNNKVADLNTKMASAVAALTQSFKDNNIAMVKDAWDIYSRAAEERQKTLQKTVDDAQKVIKESQAAQQKVTDDINEIAKDAAKNGAPASMINKITSAGSVAQAIAMAGDSLQTATGQLGDYLQYKRQAEAQGIVPHTYQDWKRIDDQNEISLAYSKSYASSKGSAAGRLSVEGISGAVGSNGKPLKSLSDAQAKDLLYAQRGDQAIPVLDKYQDIISKMSSSNFAIQKRLEQNNISSPLVSPTIRQISQAERNFATAVLRKESGAAISPSEFATVEKQYFPRPGDDVTTLAQKAQNRNTAISSFKMNVPNYDDRIAQTTSNVLLQQQKSDPLNLNIGSGSQTSNPNNPLNI